MNIEEKYIKQDQVNLLVYGPDRPNFKQKQNILIYYFYFLKKRYKTTNFYT